MHTTVSALAAATLALAAPALASASMRCGSALVGSGRTTLELTAACGPPAHVARRTVISAGATPGARVYEDVETWTYPGDGSTFTRLVEVRRGVIASVTTAGYLADPASCARLSPSLGTTVGELEVTCGAPADRSSWVEERVGKDGRPRRFIHHERWTVSAGPGRLLRVLEFEDGKLVRVDTGARQP